MLWPTAVDEKTSEMTLHVSEAHVDIRIRFDSYEQKHQKNTFSLSLGLYPSSDNYCKK